MYSYKYEGNNLLYFKKSEITFKDTLIERMNIILNDIFECQILIVEGTQLFANLDKDFYIESNEFVENNNKTSKSVDSSSEHESSKQDGESSK